MEISQEGLRVFLEENVPELKKLATAANLAYWEATTTGTKESEEKLAATRAELLRFAADRERYDALKAFKEAGRITDPLLSRQLTVLLNEATQYQMSPEDIAELVRRETEIEMLFANFRAEADGRTVSDNDIIRILEDENDSGTRQQAWEASKRIGVESAPKILELVKLRNRVAKNLGYRDYYEMSLELQELPEKDLFGILDELEALTRAPFARMKAELDRELGGRFGIGAGEVMPWHYSDPFFQETPTAGGVDLNPFLAGKDPVALTKEYYRGLGMDIEDILARSDLYERPGKNQHAFCTHIDNSGDVRVLANVRPNEKSTGTLYHEFGHAVYDKYIDQELPYVLRSPAHTFTTEAVAMLSERQLFDDRWLVELLGLPADDAREIAAKSHWRASLGALIFARWGLVVVHFERELYRNPNADYNALWWQYVEKLQLIRKPADRRAPDWAAKIHLATVPVYYHNYLLGSLAAAQFGEAVKRAVGEESFVNRPAAGTFFREDIFHSGARYRWDEHIRRATGEPLTAKFFADQYVSQR